MEGDPLLLYLIVGIILIVIVLGLLIWAILSVAKSSSGRQDQKQEAQQTARASQEQESAPSSGSLLSTRSSSQTLDHRPEDTELLRAFRDANTGAIYVEIKGKQYHQLTDVRDPQTGRLLLQTVADLGRFTQRVTPAVQTEGSPASAQRQTEDASLVQPTEEHTPKPPDSGSLARRGEALIDDPQPNTSEPTASLPSSDGLMKRAQRIPEDSTRDAAEAPGSGSRQASEGAAPTFAPNLSPKRSEEKAHMGTFWGRALSTPSIGAGVTGPRPLADELEDVLKDLIDSTPESIPRDVHFRTAADGSLLIEVDGESYHSVAEVKDPIGQRIIKVVIAKWEKQ
jgi:hypothetical protein